MVLECNSRDILFAQFRQVMWVRRTVDKVSLLTVGNITYSGDPRIKVMFIYPNNWRLSVKKLFRYLRWRKQSGFILSRLRKCVARIFHISIFHSFSSHLLSLPHTDKSNLSWWRRTVHVSFLKIFTLEKSFNSWILSYPGARFQLIHRAYLRPI